MSKRACNWCVGKSEPFYMLRLMGINPMIAMYVALDLGVSQKVYFICGIHCVGTIFSTQETIGRPEKVLKSLCYVYHSTQPSLFSAKCICTHALRSSQNCQFIQPFAKSNAFKYSFVPSTCSKWNKLPADVSLSPSLSSFKNSLLSYLQE